MIVIKRVYEPFEKEDGYRVLVDRLWPRGLSKERANVDLWLKDIAPSNELRKLFGHKPERFNAFREAYKAELDANQAVTTLRSVISAHKKVTLLYGAHDKELNQAIILQEYLKI